MQNFKIFQPFVRLRYGLSERSDGSMKILPGGLNDENRRRFFAARGLGRTVAAAIIHGTSAVRITADEGASIIPDADALVSSVPGVSLSITVADCFPVYFFDPTSSVIGLAHAGWRGIASGIIETTITAMIKAGANIRTTMCAVGPGVQRHHFEVKDDVVAQFGKYRQFISSGEKRIMLDLPRIILQQALDFGLSHDNMELSSECTYCLADIYFSHRRDKTEPIEAMAAYMCYQ